MSELDLASLDGLDFSSWHGELPDSADELLPDNPYHHGVAPDRVDGGGVLTLDMLLGVVRDADHPVRLLVETKHPTRYGGLVEQTLVDSLRRFGWAGRPGPPATVRDPGDPGNRVVVMSFAPTAVRRIKLLAPDVPTVLLMERFFGRRRDGVLPAGVTIAGPGLHLLHADPDFVARAHARGHPVFVWTVDEPADVRHVLSLGVDAIITDRLAEVSAQLDNECRRAEPPV